MNNQATVDSQTYVINPIGCTRGPEDGFRLEIFEAYRSALDKLDRFSHVIVFWWANEHDNEADRRQVRTDLPYAEGESAGVFACRSEYRPNPIAATVCRIVEVDEESGVVWLEYNDAFDGSPIVDLKPYIPVSDRVRDVKVPDWFSQWPDWWEDAGEFFSTFSRDE
ncbi:MAG: tRNA (N6-threonylcarbamoyladenosine(37)-N6)-methyltransferase TrmO [Proteobacteria bacterium]|nr:tRNA (N6-threonylcarbamoyladenosine(37)-N6)-methyltransferase TrmO [Pseudomonadota bacterium]